MRILLPLLFYFSLLFALAACHTERQKNDSSVEAHAKALAQQFIITDGHIDLPYRMNMASKRSSREVVQLISDTKGDFDYERAKEGGLDAPFMSIYIPASYQESGGAKALADSLINSVINITEQYPDQFALANTPRQVEENISKGLISLPMGMENGAPIGDSLENVQYFFDRGIRYITLTHGKANQICDSSYDSTRVWNGLSPFGEQVVTAMNQVGIMVDVSHISDSAFYDVMKITKAPVIASHSSCRHFVPGFERNMSDEMIKTLAENGGVIQINFGSGFIDATSKKKSDQAYSHLEHWLQENNLTEEDSAAQAYMDAYLAKNPVYSTVEKVADHIDHVVQLVGIDHVCFGSDFDGVGDTLPEGLKDVSDYPNLIAELLRRNYSEEDIEKICYKNVFRVWNEVLEIATQESGSSIN